MQTTETTINYTGKLPSINHIYGRNKKQFYLLPDAQVFIDAILHGPKSDTLPRDKEVGYELIVKGNWYNKKGSKTRIKKRDSNNMLKLIIDACCKAIDIDDSQIFEENIVKVQDSVEGFEITFYVLDK